MDICYYIYIWVYGYMLLYIYMDICYYIYIYGYMLLYLYIYGSDNGMT